MKFIPLESLIAPEKARTILAFMELPEKTLHGEGEFDISLSNYDSLGECLEIIPRNNTSYINKIDLDDYELPFGEFVNDQGHIRYKERNIFIKKKIN